MLVARKVRGGRVAGLAFEDKAMVKKAIRLRSEDSVERVALSSRTKYHWQVLRVCVVSDAVLAMPVHEKSVE